VLPVFVGVVTELSDEASAVLTGVGAGEGSGGVATATLSARQVSDLSEYPWVRYLRLSGRLELLEP